jgi:hypothetical protein
MAIAVMRNRVSTEFRKVEKDSDDYLELQAQRDPNDGRPVWEETGPHDAIEQSARLEAGAAVPSDIGDAQQPVATMAGAALGKTAGDVPAEQTPSEVAAGVEPEEVVTLPVTQPPDEEVPLVAGMESATATDTSGTEPDLTADKPKKSRAKSKKSESAESPSS